MTAADSGAAAQRRRYSVVDRVLGFIIFVGLTTAVDTWHGLTSGTVTSRRRYLASAVLFGLATTPADASGVSPKYGPAVKPSFTARERVAALAQALRPLLNLLWWLYCWISPGAREARFKAWQDQRERYHRFADAWQANGPLDGRTWIQLLRRPRAPGTWMHVALAVLAVLRAAVEKLATRGVNPPPVQVEGYRSPPIRREPSVSPPWWHAVLGKTLLAIFALGPLVEATWALPEVLWIPRRLRIVLYVPAIMGYAFATLLPWLVGGTGKGLWQAFWPRERLKAEYARGQAEWRRVRTLDVKISAASDLKEILGYHLPALVADGNKEKVHRDWAERLADAAEVWVSADEQQVRAVWLDGEGHEMASVVQPVEQGNAVRALVREWEDHMQRYRFQPVVSWDESGAGTV